MPTLKTNLKPARLAAGLSQTALARQAAISRQAYVAIETGRSVPSTEVSLRLARALSCTVESLFSLPFEEGSTVRAELMPTPYPSPVPSRVQLFSVGGRLLARPLSGRSSTSYTMTPADGIAITSDSPDDVSVRLLAPLDQANMLVLAGGDPAIPFLSRDLALRDFRMVRLGEDSNTALSYLSAGTAHVAGCHLFDETTGQYNVSWVRRLAPFPCSVITFAIREQGLIVAAGNPKNIASIDDLSRPDLSFINREEGSGSRALMDRLISRAGLTPDAINGYQRTAGGHLAVADTVAPRSRRRRNRRPLRRRSPWPRFRTPRPGALRLRHPQPLPRPPHGPGFHRDLEAALLPTPGRSPRRLRHILHGRPCHRLIPPRHIRAPQSIRLVGECGTLPSEKSIANLGTKTNMVVHRRYCRRGPKRHRGGRGGFLELHWPGRDKRIECNGPGRNRPY